MSGAEDSRERVKTWVEAIAEAAEEAERQDTIDIVADTGESHTQQGSEAAAAPAESRDTTSEEEKDGSGSTPFTSAYPTAGPGKAAANVASADDEIEVGQSRIELESQDKAENQVPPPGIEPPAESARKDPHFKVQIESQAKLDKDGIDLNDPEAMQAELDRIAAAQQAQEKENRNNLTASTQEETFSSKKSASLLHPRPSTPSPYSNSRYSTLNPYYTSYTEIENAIRALPLHRGVAGPEDPIVPLEVKSTWSDSDSDSNYSEGDKADRTPDNPSLDPAHGNSPSPEEVRLMYERMGKDTSYMDPSKFREPMGFIKAYNKVRTRRYSLVEMGLGPTAERRPSLLNSEGMERWLKEQDDKRRLEVKVEMSEEAMQFIQSQQRAGRADDGMESDEPIDQSLFEGFDSDNEAVGCSLSTLEEIVTPSSPAAIRSNRYANSFNLLRRSPEDPPIMYGDAQNSANESSMQDPETDSQDGVNETSTQDPDTCKPVSYIVSWDKTTMQASPPSPPNPDTSFFLFPDRHKPLVRVPGPRPGKLEDLHRQSLSNKELFSRMTEQVLGDANTSSLARSIILEWRDKVELAKDDLVQARESLSRERDMRDLCRKKIKNLEFQIEQQKGVIEKLENKEIDIVKSREEAIVDAEEEEKRLKSEIEQLRGKNQKLEENSNLARSLKESNEEAEKVEHLESQTEQLRGELKAIEDLESQIQGWPEAPNSVERDAHKTIKEIREERENATCQMQHDKENAINQTQEDKEKTVAELRARKAHLENEAKISQRERSEVERKPWDMLNEGNAKFQKEYEQQKGLLESLTKDRDDFIKKYHEIKLQLQEEQSAVEKENKTIDSQQREIGGYREQVALITSENEAQAERIVDLEKKLEDTKEEEWQFIKAQFELKVDQLEEHIAELGERNDGLDLDHQSKAARLELTEAEIKEIKEMLEQREKTTTATLNGDAISAETQLEECKDRLDRLQKVVKAMEKESNEVREYYINTEASLHRKIRDLEEELDEARAGMKSSRNGHSDMASGTEALQQLWELEVEGHALKADLASSRMENKHLVDQVQVLQSTLSAEHGVLAVFPPSRPRKSRRPKYESKEETKERKRAMKERKKYLDAILQHEMSLSRDRREAREAWLEMRYGWSSKRPEFEVACKQSWEKRWEVEKL